METFTVLFSRCCFRFASAATMGGDEENTRHIWATRNHTKYRKEKKRCHNCLVRFFSFHHFSLPTEESEASLWLKTKVIFKWASKKKEDLRRDPTKWIMKMRRKSHILSIFLNCTSWRVHDLRPLHVNRKMEIYCSESALDKSRREQAEMLV